MRGAMSICYINGYLSSGGVKQWLEQAVDAVPCDLDADAEEDKRDDAKDSVDG